MLLPVFQRADDLEIVGPVVERVLVDMMNLLALLQWPSKHLLYNDSMLVFPASGFRDLYNVIELSWRYLVESSTSKRFLLFLPCLSQRGYPKVMQSFVMAPSQMSGDTTAVALESARAVINSGSQPPAATLAESFLNWLEWRHMPMSLS